MQVKRCEPSLAVNIHSVSRTTTIEDEAVQSAPGPSLKARGGALGAHSRPLSRFTSTSPMARSTSLSLRVLRIFFVPGTTGSCAAMSLRNFLRSLRGTKPATSRTAFSCWSVRVSGVKKRYHANATAITLKNKNSAR